MNWYRFAFVAAALLVLQTTLAGRIALLHAPPVLTIALVAYVALTASPFDALLAAWLLGFGVDILSIERLGVTAVTHTLAVLPVLAVRDYFFAKSAPAHFVVALLAALTQQTLASAFARLAYPDAFSYTRAVSLIAVSSVYSAVLAVAIIGLLVRIGPAVVAGSTHPHAESRRNTG